MYTAWVLLAWFARLHVLVIYRSLFLKANDHSIYVPCVMPVYSTLFTQIFARLSRPFSIFSNCFTNRSGSFLALLKTISCSLNRHKTIPSGRTSTAPFRAMPASDVQSISSGLGAISVITSTCTQLLSNAVHGCCAVVTRTHRSFNTKSRVETCISPFQTHA